MSNYYFVIIIKNTVCVIFTVLALFIALFIAIIFLSVSHPNLRGGLNLITRAHLRPSMLWLQNLPQNPSRPEDCRLLDPLHWEVYPHLSTERCIPIVPRVSRVSTVPSAPITSWVTGHLTFHNFFGSLHLLHFASSFICFLASPGTSKSMTKHSLVYLYTTTISGWRACITWSVHTLKSENSFTQWLSLNGSASCWHHWSLCFRLWPLERRSWTNTRKHVIRAVISIVYSSPRQYLLM